MPLLGWSAEGPISEARKDHLSAHEARRHRSHCSSASRLTSPWASSFALQTIFHPHNTFQALLLQNHTGAQGFP